ncbi:MAG: DMT family transporter [Bacteroidota bacterium]|nr:DMT family transporter [Bacteroidota bacterium]MDP4190153.1 DMT family transporter [Bacteroidota bacterium]MDP4193752.1 DMT family transporter [Bacteroidota bacterium]
MAYSGELSALVTAILWSFTSLCFSEASVRVGSLQVNVTRLLIAALFLILTILLMGFPVNLSSSQLINLSLSGLIGLIFGDTFLFRAYQNIGARLSQLLMAAAPAMTAILAFFWLGEVFSIWGIIGMIVTLVGIAMVVMEKNEVPSSKYKISKSGIFYGFLGALGQAAGLIFAKKAFAEGDINGFVATFIRIFASIIVILPAGIIIKRYKNPFRIFSKDKKALGFTTAGSILGPYLGITFSLIAVANTKVGIAATIMATSPIIMLPMIKYFYKEKLSWRSITGAFVAVAGVAILFLR